MDFVEKARIMDATRINRALSRLASEIVERNLGTTDLMLVGIRRRGVPLAERIAEKIKESWKAWMFPSDSLISRSIVTTSARLQPRLL